MSIKIIETNLMYKDDKIVDHQSRIIEYESWDKYVKIFTEYNPDKTPENIKPLLGYMMGGAIHKNATIEKLEYDEFHLRCCITNFANQMSVKLAYMIEE